MALFVALPPLSVPFLVSGAVGSPAHVANVPWETAPPRWISEHVLRGGKERLRPPIDTIRPWRRDVVARGYGTSRCGLTREPSLSRVASRAPRAALVLWLIGDRMLL
jgi:hypothetical protein